MQKSLSEKVAELTGLRDSGQLSDSEYEVLLAKAIKEMGSSTVRKTPRPTDSSQTSFVLSQTQQELETSSVKTASSNGVESAVKVVAILVAAAALGFGFLLPFKVNNVGGTTMDKSCNPPVVEVFRSEVKNADYMKYGADNGEVSDLRAAIANIGGPIRSNKICQDAAKDRMILVAVMLVMSTLAVVFSKRASNF